ncbi:MAG: hypothetical protein AUJ12_04395 [Alphaproteobacteria bacterium CG1_02_46_17]|nr:MAG: hypothetical protein AUJ12_04395 [Alphaproteobacteria bacterium CG1_02_46_17]
MPIPDQFIGRWEPVSKNVWQPITIERTSTGALITADTTVSDAKGHVHRIIDTTTINIFAAVKTVSTPYQRNAIFPKKQAWMSL